MFHIIIKGKGVTFAICEHYISIDLKKQRLFRTEYLEKNILLASDVTFF